MSERLPFLSDQFHFAIASVAARSSQLDHHIEIAIAHMLQKLPKTAAYLLKNLGQDRVVGLYHSLMLDHFPKNSDEIGTLVRLIKDLRSDRNEILHWIWGKTENEHIAKHVSFRPFRKQEEKLKTADNIAAIANAMLEITQIITLWQMILEKSGNSPLPETPFPPVPLGGWLSSSTEGQQESVQSPLPQQDSSPS